MLTGSVKLGHPVPESNLASDRNSSAPQPAQRYTPSSWTFQYAPVNARSVPLRRRTSYCSGVRRSRHSSSVIGICVSMSVFAPFLVARLPFTRYNRVAEPPVPPPSRRGRPATLGRPWPTSTSSPERTDPAPAGMGATRLSRAPGVCRSVASGPPLRGDDRHLQGPQLPWTAVQVLERKPSVQGDAVRHRRFLDHHAIRVVGWGVR